MYSSKTFMTLSCLVYTMLLGSQLFGQVAEEAESKPAARRGETSPTAMDLVEQRFNRAAPQIGDSLPSLTVFDADGNDVPLDNLRGSYTVLTFGCLT
jgi:hypothetical protein